MAPVRHQAVMPSQQSFPWGQTFVAGDERELQTKTFDLGPAVILGVGFGTKGSRANRKAKSRATSDETVETVLRGRVRSPRGHFESGLTRAPSDVVESSNVIRTRDFLTHY